MIPISVNYHLYKPCNLKCRFCFATFRDVRGRLSLADATELVTQLRRSGAEKITFVGGEPTLYPHIGELLVRAKQLGFVTCLVTNGARLHDLLNQHAAAIDWVGLSVDSADEQTQAALGRGDGNHVGKSIELAARLHRVGMRVKLNTVVTALNHAEDMAGLVRTVRPARWKVFQVLPIAGQNDGSVEELLIDDEQFGDFVDRHAPLNAEGFGPVVEANDAMLGSYVMVDPLGRFYGNSTGRHIYSDPILDVGVEAALAQVGFSPSKFEARGGQYAW